ncbi:ABC transporter permease [Propionibacterium australiense]|uniref:FtsX-like permease family n=1 Tax=Propionibacterium australiense TaxID=119981 RepID=A0A383S768_9ACTN|nr:ABC transporter permease [Propionibacterium australiense]RLP08183.1 FtsX-like permease family protein [Propionibacterium australiense]RLP08289.1 FtsX-like permease family protein [Propionibacterium australiense]SYZ33096.1 FtsX-like permease family [Propionibacterium australiense]VEH89112.1 Macrolide export ATP-binding/permease protein MacB [Propionibacterium australiense]
MIRQPRRLLSAGIAIALGVTFMTATLLFASSLNASIRELAAGQVRDAAVVISPGDHEDAKPIEQQTVDAVAATPGVEQARAAYGSWAQLFRMGAKAQVGVNNLPELTDKTTLVEGRLPQTDGEVAVNIHLRDSYGIELGEEITTQSYADQSQTQSKVVGFIDASSDAVSSPGSDYLFATDSGAVAITGIPGYSSIMVSGDDPEALKTAISEAAAIKDGGFAVRTGSEQAQYQIDQMAGASRSITGFLLIFAGIALFVSVIVIANTFSILVAQRARQLAMMRCVGATKGQVFSTVIGEALMLGAIGSAAGLAAGVGLTWVFLHFGQGLFTTEVTFSAGASAFIAPFVVGVLITFVSSLGAARRATSVAPLAALHPELAAAETKQLGLVRGILGALLAVAGVALLVAGWRMAGTLDDEAHRTATILTAMAGAALAWLGVIVLGRGLIPALARVIGSPLSRTSVPGELAVSNSRRNPARAAATANALLVGVTLIGTLTVGAACSQATVDRELGNHYPQDAIVAPAGEVSDGVLHQIRDTQDVTGAERVTATQAQAESGGMSKEVEIVGVSHAAAQITRAPQRYEGVRDSELFTSDTDFIDGQQVMVSQGDRSVELTARVSPAYPDALVVTPATMFQLAPDASTHVWVRYADKADAQRVTSQLGQIDALKNAPISSNAVERAVYQRLIDVVLLVATALLAIAVLIAVVGVGNTLSLSVLERTQELGMLRATGMTRGQVRKMVALESMTLASVATVIGLGLSVVFGIVGARALLQSPDISMVVDLPWLRLALIAVVALLSGWLASLAPASRAVKVSPAAALAAE